MAPSRPTNPTLSQLLDIETQTRLWSYQVNDVHLWSLIRTNVIRESLNRELGIKNRQAPVKNQKRLRWSHLKHHLHFLTHFLPPHRQLHDALFIKASTTRFTNPDGKTSRDRLYDPYFAYFDNPLILEDMVLQTGFLSDHAYETYTLETLNLINSLLKRVYRIPVTVDKQCEDFARMVATEFAVEHMLPDLIVKLQGFVRVYHIQKQLIERFMLPFMKTSHVFMHAASYLTHHALHTRALHELGFTVHELQHGLLYPIHVAYHHPDECFDDTHPSRRYLPDTFLTYGAYWEELIRLPVRCVPVGYPYLNEITQQASAIPVKDNQHLVISQLLHPDGSNPLADMAEELALAHPDIQVAFKLHPRENHLINHYAYLNKISNLQVIAGDQDTYRLIAESPTIVGNNSTVLAEALAFEDKRIFFSGSENYLSPEIGYRFQTTSELVDVIADPSKGYPKINTDQMWLGNWAVHFDAFCSHEAISQ